MIPALDMSKVHAERNSLAREEQSAPRPSAATVTATTNNAAYTSIGGSATTPGRALPLRNQPTSASTQLLQSARPSSSSVTPQTSPRGPMSSARLVQRAQDVEGYLGMNPLSCTDVRSLQRMLIATAEAALRMRRQHEEESRLRMEIYEQRLSDLTLYLAQSPPMSLAGNPSHKGNHAQNTAGNGNRTPTPAGSSSPNASLEKGAHAAGGMPSSRSGRRYPVTSTPVTPSSQCVAANSSSIAHRSHGSSNTAAAGALTVEKTPVTGAGSARRPNRLEAAHRAPPVALTGTPSGPIAASSSSGGVRVGEAPSSLPTAVASASSSADVSHAPPAPTAMGARSRLDAASYQESPLRTREPTRRGSVTSYAGSMSYQDLGEGLGLAGRATTATERLSPTAQVHRSLNGGRGGAMSSGRQDAAPAAPGRHKGGSHSARAAKVTRGE